MREAAEGTSVGTAGREPPLGERLARAGPLFAALGQFLCWRTDLVPPAGGSTLRPLTAAAPPLPRADVAGLLVGTLGDAGRTLAARLDPSPCWSTPWRCAYRATHDDRPVVVQVARDPLPDSAFDACEAGLRAWRHPGLDAALSPEAWRQFREWVRLADDPARERACLDAYGQVAGEAAVRLPAPIPALSAGRVLCWPWVDARPARAVVGADGDGVVRISEGLLDALLVLSVIDGDLDLEALAVDDHGRLVLRRATRLIPLPPGSAETALEYVSAVVAGDDALAARWLARLAGERHAGRASEIADAHWRLVPHVGANLRLRRSAAAFDGLWRALAAVGPARPLFLDAMHRSLVALGTWDAETPAPDDGEPDRLEEAHWAVLGRLIRARIDDVRTGGGAEWLAAVGLSLIEGGRQAVGMESETGRGDGWRRGARGERAEDETAGPTRARLQRQVMVVVALTAVWLAAVRWGSVAGGIGPAMVAAAAAAGLFWVVSRMG